jgi:DNA-binding transcriptional LysR family regulator
MPAVNLNAFDLNLLLVFDAVMQERNVTRAGELIGLSQPAMSHALNRLRYLLDDELFVRTPTGMAPTPRAETLAAPLRSALSDVRLALEPAAFDPATSDRRFALAVSNFAAVLVVPPLVAAVSSAAPAIGLDVQPRGTLDLAERLDRGDLDLVLGAVEGPGERFATTCLVEYDLVPVMRLDHPAGRRPLSAAAFAALAHLEISSSLDDTSFIDLWLAERGLSRRIALRAPFLSTPEILAQSDLVANMCAPLARRLTQSHPLQICKPPYESPCVRLTMLWHRRLDQHPAHRWLRETALSVARGV